METIDYVVTWLNSSDSELLKEYEFYNANSTGNCLSSLH